MIDKDPKIIVLNCEMNKSLPLREKNLFYIILFGFWLYICIDENGESEIVDFGLVHV